jgi:hypothetical protein
MFIKKREFFWMFFLFFIAYSAVFYLFFRFEHRFLLPLVPLSALVAGYGLSFFRGQKAIIITAAALLAAFSLRLGYLNYAGDSRVAMKRWIENNIPAGSKIIVDARLMRLSSTREALEEQSRIDPSSLRQVDRSEIYFGKNPKYTSFHAINLNFINNDDFKDGIEKYALEEGYEYFVSEGDIKGERIVSFGGVSNFSVTDSRIGLSPLELFETSALGPEVSLYNLPAGKAGLR